MKIDAIYYVCFGIFARNWRPEVAAVYSPPYGSVQWAVQSLEVSPSASSFSVWLLRPYPSNRSLVAHIAVDDKNGGVGAARNLNFTEGQYAWMGGDKSAREVRIPVLNASYLDSTNEVRLLITSTDPPGAQHPSNQVLNVTLANFSTAGHIEFSSNVIATEEEPSQDIDECLVYATRARGLGERTTLNLSLVKCESPLNAAFEGTDFDVYSTGLGTVWEPLQSDTRCVLRKLGRTAIGEIFGVLIWRDSRKEGWETICVRPTISPAESTLSARLLIIGVQDGSTSHIYRCAKGQECRLNCSDTVLDPDDEIIIHENGRVLCDSTSLQIKKFHARDCPVSYGEFYDVSNTTEAYFVFLCSHKVPSAPARLLGTFEIRGPVSDNTVSCVMGSPVCLILLREHRPDPTNEFVQIVYDRACRDFNSTPSGFRRGANAKISTRSTTDLGSYYLTDPTLMAQEEAGIYQICWCQRLGATSCFDQNQNGGFYGVRAGLFFYSGPYNFGVQYHSLGGELSLGSDVTGIQLSSKDRVALQKVCGVDDNSQPVVAQASASSRAYRFGVVGMDQVDAAPYYLCWCQPHTYRTESDVLGTMKCDQPSDFVSPFGLIVFKCPDRYADINGDGHCQLCRSWQEADLAHLVCEIDPRRLLWIVCSSLLGAFCWLMCFMQTGIIFNHETRRLKVRGRAILIEDITTEGDGVIVTTKARHKLHSWVKPVPVFLEKTGSKELDSKLGNLKKFLVQVDSPQRLKLLEADGTPVAFKAESSNGTLTLQIRNGIFHTLILRALPVSILIFCSFLVALGIRVYYLLAVDTSFFFILHGVDVAGGVILRALYNVQAFSEGGHINSISACLSVYRRRLADGNPNPRPFHSAPNRAITAFQLYDLQEFFSAFIKLRSTYYVYPNILEPLTKRLRLSYAEVAGPRMVGWFVSYYHGTPFRHFCESIRLHSVTTVEGDDIQGWMSATYWICAFSTNHYQMEAELVRDLRESSYHKALHSEACKGTCIVMDEEAFPLTRSWCLFEVLQTIQLERTREGFKGLLFCSRTGVLNYGAASTTLSMNIGNKLATLKLENAKASSHEDTDKMMQLALEQWGSFDMVNKALHDYIGSALLVCKTCVEHEFSLLVGKLHRTNGDETPSPYSPANSSPGLWRTSIDRARGSSKTAPESAQAAAGSFLPRREETTSTHPCGISQAVDVDLGSLPEEVLHTGVELPHVDLCNGLTCCAKP